MTASLTTNALTANSPTTQSLTADLARRIVASDPLADAEAVQAARVALVDFLACAIAGATDPALAILLDTLGGVGAGDATLIGRAARADAFTAALANGHAGHALDYDDVHASVRGHHLVCGTAVEIADDLQRWFEGRAADGFNIMPSDFPGGLDDFVEQVVPILQERGLFRTEYEGTTLRDHFGLPRPASTLP